MNQELKMADELEINILTKVSIKQILENIKIQCDYSGDYRKERDKMLMRVEYYLSLIKEGKIAIKKKQKERLLSDFLKVS